jgi:para-nitrobenzyl esterase
MNNPKRLLVLLGLFAGAFISFKISGKERLDPVKVDGGLISGTLDGDINIYKGIPFAAPPVDDLRWKAPQPVKSWDGVRKCLSFGPSPMQGKPVPFSMWSEEFLIPKEPISEDCLYLNIWTGSKSAGEKRPVLVWIYGGGFSSGGAAVPIYDGMAMAKKGIVFVSINYRVGIFGFFAHPELTKESANHASGNYGLMDQLAALQWVKRNIASFGGDPENVTIAGQSAGSFSVNCLVASPLGKGLFQKAIGESGANFTNSFPTLDKAEQAGLGIAKSLNLSSLADLRKVPAEELLKNNQLFRGPVIDGYVLPEPIAKIFASGQENPVSLLTGWNEDEGILFGPLKNASGFQQDMNQKYGKQAKTILEFYPASSDSEAVSSQMRISRDQVFGSQNYTWANRQSDHGSKVFVYRFVHKVPGTGIYAKFGAFHTGEVPYAYDNLQFVNRPWKEADHRLAGLMSSYWANFARSGDPNGQGLPVWPAYQSNDKEIMILDDKSFSRIIPDAAALDALCGVLNQP